jgi:hypothetical protein
MALLLEPNQVCSEIPVLRREEETEQGAWAGPWGVWLRLIADTMSGHLGDWRCVLCYFLSIFTNVASILSYFIFIYSFIYFETGSDCIYSRLVSNSQPSSLSLLRAGITDVYHQSCCYRTLARRNQVPRLRLYIRYRAELFNQFMLLGITRPKEVLRVWWRRNRDCDMAVPGEWPVCTVPSLRERETFQANWLNGLA